MVPEPHFPKTFPAPYTGDRESERKKNAIGILWIEIGGIWITAGME
jgi:hypothetical protein